MDERAEVWEWRGDGKSGADELSKSHCLRACMTVCVRIHYMCVSVRSMASMGLCNSHLFSIRCLSSTFGEQKLRPNEPLFILFPSSSFHPRLFVHTIKCGAINNKCHHSLLWAYVCRSIYVCVLPWIKLNNLCWSCGCDHCRPRCRWCIRRFLSCFFFVFHVPREPNATKL